MAFPRGKGRGDKYGAAHQRERRTRAAHHHPQDPCARCGQPLGPMGPWLHLDHTDDGHNYLGFSHGRSCNLHAAARKGANIVNGTTPTPRTTDLRW